MPLTDDPNDPRLTHGADDKPVPMAEVYLVLSEKERAKGFVRPLRRAYVHVGPPGPTYPLLDLSPEQQERYAGDGYAKYEKYPEGESSTIGRFWTQPQLDAIGKGGCGVQTRMGLALCETYARQPSFYGSTYCVGCLPGGMESGLPSFVAVIELPDGRRILAETSWRNMALALVALAAVWGTP